MVQDPEGVAGSDDPGSTLCRACGICCGGALFSSGSLTEEEATRLRTRLTVLPARASSGRADGSAGADLPADGPRPNVPMFAIPCPAHGPSGCTIYEGRPATCVEYACALLDRLRAGEVSLDEALRKVSELRRGLANIDPQLPRLSSVPGGGSLWARAAGLRAAAEPGAVAERRRLAATLMELVVLERGLMQLDDRVCRSGTASPSGSQASDQPSHQPSPPAPTTAR